MAQSKRHRARSRVSNRRGAKAQQTGVADVVIEKIGAGGDGIARLDGQQLYVPYTVPGDEVRVTFRGNRGIVESLVRAGTERIDPVCTHFGTCGGCALQHLSEQAYRTWKLQRVIEPLTREGFDERIVAPLISCAPASRRRVQFVVRKNGTNVTLGFNERGSNRVVDIDACPILAPQLDELIPALRDLAAATPNDWRGFDLQATLCANGVDVSFIGDNVTDEMSGTALLHLTEVARAAGVARVVVDGAPVVEFDTPVVSLGGVCVPVPSGGFLQASQEGEAALVDLVTASIGKKKRVADLFSGCGTFSLPLSATSHVSAFDSDRRAVAALDRAARSADLRHPLMATVQNLFDRPLVTDELKPFEAVVIDPPRAGARAQAEQLAQSSVPLVVSVSCNPKSFARDASILRAGGYTLSTVTPVDQFVYAAHVELVGVFTKE